MYKITVYRLTLADHRPRWEHEMPKQGLDHDKMVQSLKDRGICEEANATNAHAVADLIWTYLRGLTDRWIQVTSISRHSKNKSQPGNEPLLHRLTTTFPPVTRFITHLVDMSCI